MLQPRPLFVRRIMAICSGAPSPGFTRRAPVVVGAVDWIVAWMSHALHGSELAGRELHCPQLHLSSSQLTEAPTAALGAVDGLARVWAAASTSDLYCRREPSEECWIEVWSLCHLLASTSPNEAKMASPKPPVSSASPHSGSS